MRLVRREKAGSFEQRNELWRASQPLEPEDSISLVALYEIVSKLESASGLACVLEDDEGGGRRRWLLLRKMEAPLPVSFG